MRIMNQNIKFITSNNNKATELADILNIELEAFDLKLREVQAIDVAVVAREKAAAAYAAIRTPLIVDDTGMSLDALNNFPGALISWILDATGNDGILKLLNNNINRSATASTALAYVDEGGVQVFVGEVTGTITTEERGSYGFGYDRIFVPTGYTKTFAEMDPEIKNGLSMRRIAANKLKENIKL